jgi:oligopeptide/dipeptide ABC transporter ATP-binding protein
MAMLLITHDLGVVRRMADRVCVMKTGEIVEQTDVSSLFAAPRHPYTRGLIGAVPVPGVIQDELAVIPGSVPNLIALPEGCRFAPRCADRVEHNNVLATELHPELREVSGGHRVRCWLFHHADGSPRSDPDSWPEAALPEVPDIAPALAIPEGPSDPSALGAAVADEA